MTESDTDTGDKVWPDDLEMGDRVDIDGHDYVVVGTGPGEATLDRVNGDGVTAEVFRWAFTDRVGIEIEIGMSQDEFERNVNPDS
jgi:hypothetical protein